MKNLLKRLETVKHSLKTYQKIPFETLRHLSSVDAASLLMKLDKRQSDELFLQLLKSNLASSALSELPRPFLKEFFKNLPSEPLIKLFSKDGQMDNLVYLIDFVDEPETLFSQLPELHKQKLSKFMNYPEGSAGRIMQDDFFSVPIHFTALEGIRKLREYSREKFVHYIYCIDEEQKLKGVLSIRQLAITPAETQLKDVLTESIITVTAKHSSKEVAHIVDRHNFIAIPVVDEEQRCLGIITVDDVLDVIKEIAEADLYARAGLPEDDRVYTDSVTSIKNRFPWLLLNLIFAVVASSIISLFEQTMSRLIILATLKNIVAGIGGNTAIQTLTVTTRGLNTGDFKFTTFRRALLKETIIGASMGCVMGLGAGIITYFWKKSLLVSVVIFIAMFLNSLIAVFAGLTIPILLRKFGKDPAVSSGVIVTMITDIFGFFIFLGIATLGLMLVGEAL